MKMYWFLVSPDSKRHPCIVELALPASPVVVLAEGAAIAQDKTNMPKATQSRDAAFRAWREITGVAAA